MGGEMTISDTLARLNALSRGLHDSADSNRFVALAVTEWPAIAAHIAAQDQRIADLEAREAYLERMLVRANECLDADHEAKRDLEARAEAAEAEIARILLDRTANSMTDFRRVGAIEAGQHKAG